MLLVQHGRATATNWRGGGGPARQPQEARRATARANPRGSERATARSEWRGHGARSGPSRHCMMKFWHSVNYG